MNYDLRITIYALRLLIAFVAGCGVSAFAQSPPAEEYFHGGAQFYLSNNIPAALETVTNGLQRFPQDEKLKKLYELLNQQQQQNQQDQKQDKKDDQKQDQKKQDDKKDQQSKNDQQKKDEEKKNKDEQKKKDQQQKSADKSKDKPEDKKEDAQPVEAHAMTPQEAKQLLDAQKGDEQILMFKPEIDPKRQEKKLKDW